MSTKARGIQAKDPICGMSVDPNHAAGRSERDGKTYYFCSVACKHRFDGDGQPEAHLCCRHAA